MGIDLRVREAHHQAGTDDGGGGTAWFRNKSSVPTTSGPFLDLRAATDQGSLDLLALAAVAAVSDTGSAVDCAIVFPRSGQSTLISDTANSAVDLARWDREHGDGPVSQALAGQRTIILDSQPADPQWGAYRELMAEVGYRSLASVPVALEPGSFAALTLLARDDGVFVPAVVGHLESFCEVAAKGFQVAAELRSARTTVEDLRTAMQGRTAINVACGVIMGQNRCSYQEAFNILVTASNHRNVKARVVAESILQDLPGGAPPTHFKG